MPTISNLVVLVTSNTSQFQAGMAQAQATTAQTGSALSKFGGIAKAGLALAGYAAVKFAADSIQAYQESEVAVTKLQNAIGNSPALVGETTKAFEDQALALQDLTGFQDEEILAADEVLSRFEMTGDEIRDLVPLVLDYARATGTDAAGAAGNLGRALLGNTRALKAIGIDFTATGDRAADTAQIMDLLREKVGGAAEAFGTTSAGRIEIFNAKMDEAKEAIGKALIPALEALIPVLTEVAETTADVAPGLAKVADAAWDVLNIFPGLPEILEAAQQPETTSFFRDLSAAVVGVAKPTDDATRAFGSYFGASTKAAAATDEFTTSSEELEQQIRDQRLAMLALTDSFLGILDSANEVTEAQRELNRLEQKGKEDTKAYEDAVLDAIAAQAGLEDAVVSYAQELVEQGKTSGEVKAKIRELADQFGIQKDVVNDLIQRVVAYIRSLDTIPTHVTTTIDQVWGTQVGGHPVLAQHGGIVTRPTLAVVGEAGPEAIIPLNRLGVDRGGGVTVNIGTVIGGTPQQVARGIRDELLKLGVRNGTTGL